MSAQDAGENTVLITPLLKRLWPSPSNENVTAEEIAAAVSRIFSNSLTPVQTGALLTALNFTGLDRRADVLSKCAQAMRDAAAKVDKPALRDMVQKRGRREGDYHGGLCDIVGTGGDSHNTFNVSTTASIIASSLLLIAKHGNRASTSKSGSADLLQSITPLAPNLDKITPDKLAKLYERTNYAFLFAPTFHPGMRYVVPIRKELGWRTIFNLLGPLSNPVDGTSSTPSSSGEASLIEARLIGVARRDLGQAFAESFVLSGARKVMVVCGAEDLDELSCAGPTHCWRVEQPPPETESATATADGDNRAENTAPIESFTLTPSDFGLPTHPLSAVSPGASPAENAHTLLRLLNNDLPPSSPVLDFVLLNVAALFVVSGVCEASSSAMGEGDDGFVITERGPGGGRWKEGVRRARWCLSSGEAARSLQRFIEATHAL